MLASLMCHVPSGISCNDILHYRDEIELNYFGYPREELETPQNFTLSKITTRVMLSFSPNDVFASAPDINQLILELSNSVDLYVNNVNRTVFNHNDFIWDPEAYVRVYKQIIAFFNAHEVH